MGSFYTNITLRTTQQARVVQTLESAGRQAFISAPMSGCVVVFDRETDEQDTRSLTDLAALLSTQLECAALAVLNHDDDVLWYALFQRGKALDEYISSPAYFDDDAEEAPSGGDAALLCSAFGADARAEDVAAALRIASTEEGGFTFETDRHQDLASLLGIPTAAVGAGYSYLEAGEYPEGLGESDFRRIV